MSDTDDTDLLLLIPPDFFLVRSDLEDFDSDTDIGFGHREVKDIIVSDLISQVNDLESRVCQIETLERTSTRCSTCNDDSFVNQSIISLTESDVLRAQIKEQRSFLKKGSTDISLMVKSPNNFVPDVTSDDGIRKLDTYVREPDTVSRNNDLQSKDNIYSNDSRKLNSDNQNQKTEFVEKSLGISTQSQLSREKQTQLLNEVDSFLLSKQLITKECCENNDHQEIDLDSNEFINKSMNNAFETNQMPFSPTDNDFEIKDEDHVQSLALTEVYKLISEMEETQAEMQRKLNVNSVDKSQENSRTDRHLKSLGQVLDIDDLSTKSPKALHGKQSGNVVDQFRNERNPSNLESLNAYRLNKNIETHYALTQLPLSNEEKSNQRISKTLSPSRIATGSHNPIDVMRANLSGRQDARSTQFDDEKNSLSKISGFRRQLQFEKPLSPLRGSRSRMSLHGEQRSNNLNESQNKNESDRFIASLRTSRPVRTSLEEKFNALTMQRVGGANSKESQNVHNNGLSKPACDSLQQKISSNNLLSLSELWNKEPTFYSDDPNKLRQKLEEEKYRRQHCEQQIQALQLRVLEEQEKLAVAVRVDQEKDRAIVQITESWRKLNDHWGELEEQRHSLAQQLHAEREAAKSRSDELTKKVERWEKEVSQALDLAAGYKEKCETVQKQMDALKRDTNEKLHEADNQFQTITEENKKLTAENQNLTEQLESLQQRLKEEEDLLSKLKVELEKSRRRLEEFEAENTVLKEQKSSLTIGIKEERNRIGIMEQKLISLQQALNEAHSNEKAAREEVRVSQERMEVARTELRALYQGQLEAVVKEKLQEFQTQLESAEAALRAELQTKERQWADKGNEQCRQLHDKYKRDLLRVEQLHKAEVNSWKEKLSESERLRAAVEKQLGEEAERRADIAQRLHSVMETQWREALNIISNPVKALYEMPKEEQQVQRRGESPERLRGRISRSESTASLGPAEEAPFCREGAVTYRGPQDHQLKKYIQMLLERGPGNPFPSQNTSLPDATDHQVFPPGSSDLLDKWILENEKKTDGQPDRQNQFNKPPWR